MSGKKDKRQISLEIYKELNDLVDDGRFSKMVPTKIYSGDILKASTNRALGRPNLALEAMDYTAKGEDLRNKVGKIRSTRPANSTTPGNLHFSRRPLGDCSMKKSQIRELWNMLFLKDQTEDTVCSALAQSLILPSRPYHLINHGGYGTTLELASGQVAKIVPVSTTPRLVQHRSRTLRITPLKEAQYEAYMMHYVSKQNIVITPKLFQFYMVQPRQSLPNTMLHEWRNTTSNPSLNAVQIEPGNLLQLAVFVMSKAHGNLLETELLNSMGWLSLRRSNQTITNFGELLGICLNQIEALHRNGIIHGDCHVANILCSQDMTDITEESPELNANVLTFIDWARSMRKEDFKSEQLWDLMCMYDFAQFLRSLFEIVGKDTYNVLMKRTFNSLRDGSETKHILRQEWVLNPVEAFEDLYFKMRKQLLQVQENARMKARENE